MWFRFVLTGLLAISARAAFDAFPIKWQGLHSGGSVLVTVASPIKASDANKPLKLTIRDQLGEILPDTVPQFIAKPDHTIAWEPLGLCIEASGSNAGDAVHIGRCIGGPRQSWSFLPSGHARNAQIRLSGTANCLSVVEGQDSDLNAASIELRQCDERDAESWTFGEPLPPSRSHQHAISSLMRMPVISLTTLVALGALGLITWRLCLHAKSHAVNENQSDLPWTMDQSSVSLTAPFAVSKHRGSLLPSSDAGVRKWVPAMMTVSGEGPTSQGSTFEDVFNWLSQEDGGCEPVSAAGKPSYPILAVQETTESPVVSDILSEADKRASELLDSIFEDKSDAASRRELVARSLLTGGNGLTTILMEAPQGIPIYTYSAISAISLVGRYLEPEVRFVDSVGEVRRCKDSSKMVFDVPFELSSALLAAFDAYAPTKGSKKRSGAHKLLAVGLRCCECTVLPPLRSDSNFKGKGGGAKGSGRGSFRSRSPSGDRSGLFNSNSEENLGAVQKSNMNYFQPGARNWRAAHRGHDGGSRGDDGGSRGDDGGYRGDEGRGVDDWDRDRSSSYWEDGIPTVIDGSRGDDGGYRGDEGRGVDDWDSDRSSSYWEDGSPTVIDGW